MSSVIVQVGQCGNQIGRELWPLLLSDNRSRELIYCNGDGKIRCVQIDTEPKVVSKNQMAFMPGQIRPGSIISGKRGRGSNWALGYNGVSSESNLLEASLNAIRREVERCSSFSGFILMHSLSGGSGSGFGSRIVESLRDLYPLANQMSCCVLAHALGEAPLQNYNTLLCTCWLQKFCDSIVYFSNDDILYRLLHRSKRSSNQSSDVISMKEMNQNIAACISNVIAPNESISPKGASIGLEPWSMQQAVTPMPSLKFANIDTIQRSNKVSWESITNSLLQTHHTFDPDGRAYYSIANLVISRGVAKNRFADQSQKLLSKINSAYHCVKWNPYPTDLWRDRSCVGGVKDVGSLTVASNSDDIVDKLQLIVDKSQVKYAAKAYIHWYEKHGLERNEFSEAFDAMETVIADYKDAVK